MTEQKKNSALDLLGSGSVERILIQAFTEEPINLSAPNPIYPQLRCVGFAIRRSVGDLWVRLERLLGGLGISCSAAVLPPHGPRCRYAKIAVGGKDELLVQAGHLCEVLQYGFLGQLIPQGVIQAIRDALQRVGCVAPEPGDPKPPKQTHEKTPSGISFDALKNFKQVDGRYERWHPLSLICPPDAQGPGDCWLRVDVLLQRYGVQVNLASRLNNGTTGWAGSSEGDLELVVRLDDFPFVVGSESPNGPFRGPLRAVLPEEKIRSIWNAYHDFVAHFGKEAEKADDPEDDPEDTMVPAEALQNLPLIEGDLEFTGILAFIEPPGMERIDQCWICVERLLTYLKAPRNLYPELNIHYFGRYEGPEAVNAKAGLVVRADFLSAIIGTRSPNGYYPGPLREGKRVPESLLQEVWKSYHEHAEELDNAEPEPAKPIRIMGVELNKLGYGAMLGDARVAVFEHPTGGRKWIAQVNSIVTERGRAVEKPILATSSKHAAGDPETAASRLEKKMRELEWPLPLHMVQAGVGRGWFQAVVRPEFSGHLLKWEKRNELYTLQTDELRLVVTEVPQGWTVQVHYNNGEILQSKHLHAAVALWRVHLASGKKLIPHLVAHVRLPQAPKV